MAKKMAHPGFKTVQKQIAAKQGIGMERAGAILASGARKAGKNAVTANPRLKRVSGVERGQSNQSGRGQAANRSRGQGR